MVKAKLTLRSIMMLIVTGKAYGLNRREIKGETGKRAGDIGL